MKDIDTIQLPRVLDMQKVRAYLDRLDKSLFPKLDKIGRAAELIFYKYPAPTITKDANGKFTLKTDHTYADAEMAIKDLALSKSQNKKIEEVLDKINTHAHIHNRNKEKYTEKQLILNAWNNLDLDESQLDEEQLYNSALVINTPLVFVILIKEDKEHLWGIHSDPAEHRKILGMYSGNSFLYITTFIDNIDYINETIRHEYLHFLYTSFMMATISPESLKSRDILNRLSSEDFKKVIAESDYYVTKPARDIFETIRDELVAYTFGDDMFNPYVNELMLDDTKFLNEVHLYVKEDSDKKKLLKGMDELQRTFRRFFKELSKEHRPKDVAYIILTSESFGQMVKRLNLYIDNEINKL